MRKFTLKPDRFIFVLLLFSIAVIAHAQTPEIAETSNVQSCRFLGQVEGSSGYGKNTDWHAMAKHAALSHAEDLGASHIVWERFEAVGGFNGVAVANAYQCKS